jgi:hypothetical protein
MMLDAGKLAAAVARGSHMQAHRARGRRIMTRAGINSAFSMARGSYALECGG